jgi:rhomboid protease GluP
MARRMERAAANAETTRRAVASTHRMCRNCRALVPARERSCTECGESMIGVPRGGAGRLVRLVIPSFGSVSLTIVGAIVTLYVAMAVAVSDGGFGFAMPISVLDLLGAKWGPSIVLGGEWWRLVNPIFLHGSLMHIAFNGYALANLGPVIEGVIGGRRFMVLFFVTGVMSFVASLIWAPYTPSVGASGSLFGLIGFGIVHGYTHAGPSGRMLAAQLTRWALFGALMIFLPMGIDHAAHAGGFLTGALLGWLMTGRVSSRPGVERAWASAAAASVIVVLAGFAMALLRAWGGR